jgi:hypothetical protein
MRELAARNAGLESEIRSLEQKIPSQKIATDFELEKAFEKLLPLLHSGDTLDPETKRKVIQALIHEVRITREGFEMHFYVGADQIRKGERPGLASESLQKKISGPGSFKSLNGGPTKNRTWNGPLGKGCYIHLTMGPREWPRWPETPL